MKKQIVNHYGVKYKPKLNKDEEKNVQCDFKVISAIILVTLSEYGLLENYMVFSFLPILITYQLGQYSERTFK